MPTTIISHPTASRELSRVVLYDQKQIHVQDMVVSLDWLLSGGKVLFMVLCFQGQSVKVGELHYGCYGD